MGASSILNPAFLLLFALSTLLIGAAFVYISIKAPFYWGDAYFPGVALLLAFAVTAVVGTVSLLRKPAKTSQ
ncbi:MAG TPA: hypothetical protein VLX56_02780 [Nitrososphaerales archaeon]|nr:hypothetical protein [Nitrososphaerales archaeon]